MSFIDVAMTSISEAAVYASLHSADPGTTGANETSADRVAIDLTPGSGSLTASNLSFSGGTPNGAVTHVGFWDAIDGNFIDAMELSAESDGTFNALGEYIVDTVTLNIQRTA